MHSEASEALEVQERWISCHLYYHEDLDRVLRGFVHPVVVSLVEAARIEAFFFIRYGLGGPHVRLRLRALPGSRDHVQEEVQRFAQDFLDLTPSTKSLEEEVIRKTNEFILGSDPHESDGSIYPDNSFRVMPFRPEIQRYGGRSRFQASLDFFTLSSVAAVEFLFRHGDRPRSAQLAYAFRLLLQQALGFAIDETELLDLLRYGVDSMGEIMPKIVEKGDKVARSQMKVFLKLFHQSLSAVSSLHAESEPFSGASDFLALGAGRLSEAARTADRATRAGIGGSQLHMTATRLGLSNAEEVYLSRLLTATLEEALVRDEADLSWIEEKVSGEESAAAALSALVPPALSALVVLPAPWREASPST
ncbi:MAG: lantibiotic dehydratase C-terminal domain-containing protein [Thermoanaerobaculia bacterium]